MEEIPKKQDKKQALWQQEIERLESIEGPQSIDKDIKEILVALNLHGITTIASCGGHANGEFDSGDTPWPWVLISPESQSRLETLLTEFYQNRNSDEDIILKVSKAENNEFYLSNTADDEDLDIRLSHGEVTEEEKTEIISKLRKRQQEMKDFAAFLKMKFFGND